MNYSLGLDIGSSSVKLSLVDESGSSVYSDDTGLLSSPEEAIRSLISSLSSRINLESIVHAAATGSGQSAIPVSEGWSYYSSALATAAGILIENPKARTIIQLGGQTSLVIELEKGLEKPWRVATNPLCAAGTGRFLEQQSYRLGISLNEFSRLALSFRGSAPRIAARCSVFAKSDMIHLQQKGVSLEAMLYGLCESIARMVCSLKKGCFLEPVLICGGVAANGAILRALAEAFSLRNGHEVRPLVPGNYLAVQSVGAAKLAWTNCKKPTFNFGASLHSNYYHMPSLPAVDGLPTGSVAGIHGHCRGHLGVDIGSTSTKAVLLDETGGTVLAKSYVMTAGQPIAAVKQVFGELLQNGADLVEIISAGITGSGRYLVGNFIGADLIKNEITAQARAASVIDADADVIEIGGQDSKLIIKKRGNITDYQMNKACAAGTGSFIDELAELLGIKVQNGEFARLALSAPYTVELGSRCAAFIGQAVAAARQDGLGLDIISGSLTTSIAKNYMSKVVAHRRLANKVILTGAVFYNEAVVAAFRRLLPDRKMIVADHREVSGAIGAALLARELGSQSSRFKGFQSVVETESSLTNFTCRHCENSCSITRMKLPGVDDTFYGSRCDRYDEASRGVAGDTYFDRRANLLFRDYSTTVGQGKTVGIPRALMVYDFAPLLIGFLNALGVKVLLSGSTTKEVIELSVELSYSDSCLPLKLLYGHIASIKDRCDFILYPCSIRMGRQDGNENQKYSCPLVQASPFIVQNALSLGDRFLAPILDFSLGDEEVVVNLAKAACTMGFSLKQGHDAAVKGIESQRRFETDRIELGREILGELEHTGKTGIVIFARSYMSQDTGANLGIAEKLDHLGFPAVPLDCLPLEEINPRSISDRPYWLYEGKFIAGAGITASNPKLFGLVISNFGCGPNSFILNILEDIMGDKPFGQLEIDEHAAEAGLVTRLEAFTDTIQSFKASNFEKHHRGNIYRSASALSKNGRTLLVPRMSPHVDVLVGALQAYGVKAESLPEPNESNLEFANSVTSGTECLPYRVTLGDFMRFCSNGNQLGAYEGLMAGSYGPCRLGKYVLEQNHILLEMGFDFPIRNSVSNNAYRDMNLGISFQRLGFSCVSAVDALQRLLWRTRPYEKERGYADYLFNKYLKLLSESARNKASFSMPLRIAMREFGEAVDKNMPRRPLIGINGEIYLRANEFSNNSLVRSCEAAGLEAEVSPMNEWIKYILYRHVEDAVKSRNLRKILSRIFARTIQQYDENRVLGSLAKAIEKEEPLRVILEESRRYMSPRCGSEAVLSLGSGVCWMKNRRFAGVVSVMPHGCMPGGIVASFSEKISACYDKPWISLTYDGFKESNNQSRINEFAELVKFQHNSGRF
jgi:predicted CoA-substrate-specific enzyme activase